MERASNLPGKCPLLKDNVVAWIGAKGRLQISISKSCEHGMFTSITLYHVLVALRPLSPMLITSPGTSSGWRARSYFYSQMKTLRFKKVNCLAWRHPAKSGLEPRAPIFEGWSSQHCKLHSSPSWGCTWHKTQAGQVASLKCQGRSSSDSWVRRSRAGQTPLFTLPCSFCACLTISLSLLPHTYVTGTPKSIPKLGTKKLFLSIFG